MRRLIWTPASAGVTGTRLASEENAGQSSRNPTYFYVFCCDSGEIRRESIDNGGTILHNTGCISLILGHCIWTDAER